jgi:hypothetical protein
VAAPKPLVRPGMGVRVETPWKCGATRLSCHGRLKANCPTPGDCLRMRGALAVLG